MAWFGPEGPGVYSHGGPGLCHSRDLPGRRYCRGGLDGTTPLATRRAILQRLHTGATHVVESVTATHCLDACTVIAYLRNEAGAEVLKALIERPTTFLAMHVCNLGEVYYDFFRADGLTAAQTAWTNTLALPLLLRRDADDAFVPRSGSVKWKSTFPLPRRLP
jgi:hypothetical protein